MNSASSMPDRPDVFISYARADRPRVKPLADALIANGWIVWWDPEIRAGDRFRNVIAEVLSKSRCVVVIWSQSSVRSRWVLDEADEGANRNILVPIIFDNVDIPMSFRGYHAADFVNWRGNSDDARVRRLIKDVNTLLGGSKLHGPVDIHVADTEDKGETGLGDSPAQGTEEPETENESVRGPKPTGIFTSEVNLLRPRFLLIAAVVGSFVWIVSQWQGETKHSDPPPSRPLYSDPNESLAREDVIVPEMVNIEAGSFWMGSEDGYQDEQPVRLVTIKSFELARKELTWQEWNQCEKSGGCEKLEQPSFLVEYAPSDRESHPVVNINIADVDDYLAWINQATGRVYRLPTEAEWEYAARAGTSSKFSWGDDIEKNQANCSVCGSRWDSRSTAPVGSFDANSFGLFDMHGNVREWIADCWHQNYNGAPTDGSAWLGACASPTRQVLRGGDWDNSPELLRSASRSKLQANRRLEFAGVRLARTIP